MNCKALYELYNKTELNDLYRFYKSMHLCFFLFTLSFRSSFLAYQHNFSFSYGRGRREILLTDAYTLYNVSKCYSVRSGSI